MKREVKNIVITTFLLMGFGCVQAQITEGFDDINTLTDWSFINQSNPVGTNSYFQGNDTVFPAFDGASTAYLAVNFNSTAGATGQICNYAILPDAGTVNELIFHTRTADASTFADRLRVVYSPTGGVNVGDCINGNGDFTDTLLTVNENLVAADYPAAWTEFTVPVNGNGRLAFVYDVPNGGPSGANSNFIGIDAVQTTTGPSDLIFENGFEAPPEP